jgi:hypothetical protein
MKTISTKFDTARIVERMLLRQSHRPVDTQQHRQGQEFHLTQRIFQLNSREERIVSRR